MSVYQPLGEIGQVDSRSTLGSILKLLLSIAGGNFPIFVVMFPKKVEQEQVDLLALQETTQWLWLSMLGNLRIHLLSINGSRGYKNGTNERLLTQII